MLGMSFNRMMDVRSLCGMCQCLLNMVCASSLTLDKLAEVFHPPGNISGSTGCWNELYSVMQGLFCMFYVSGNF